MKLSEFIKNNPYILDIDIVELAQKYLVDVEKITNGLLTSSKMLGTLLALYPIENMNSKMIHEFAEKLLK